MSKQVSVEDRASAFMKAESEYADVQQRRERYNQITQDEHDAYLAQHERDMSIGGVALGTIKQAATNLWSAYNDPVGTANLYADIIGTTIGGGLELAAERTVEAGSDIASKAAEKITSGALGMVGFNEKSREHLGQQVGQRIGEAIPSIDIPDVPRLDPEQHPTAAQFTGTQDLGRELVAFMAYGGPIARALGGGVKAGASLRTEYFADATAGLIADFAMYEEENGTLSDTMRAMGVDNAYTQYLAGELAEDRFEARLMSAAEGAGLGSAAFFLLSGSRIMKAARQNMSMGPVAGSPAAQRGSVGVPPTGDTARATATSAEQKYFDQILASEADRAELLDAAPSARMENGEFMVDPADIEGLRQWIDDTVAAGGKIPPGLRNDDFLKRLEAQGAGAPRETAEVVSLADRRQQAKQEHERILNEIRMRVTDELQGMQTEARMKDIDPDSVHKIGDRFMAGETSGPTAERRGQGRVRLEIKGYDSVSDDGTVRYLVEQTFPDGTKAEVRLTNENLQGAQKFGGLESAPAARAATVEPTGREMPFEERIDKYLTDEEKLLMTPKDRETMERLLTTTATPEEVASMAAAGGTKRGWYAESAAALRHIFGDDADRFAMLLSATSPQTSVESNLRNALNVWKNWTKAGRPTDLKEIKRIMGESVEGDKGEDSVLGAWINNSARALSDPNAMPIRMSGPKVNSFWRNLMGQLGEVTQDTWMARALGMSQARDFSGRNLKQFADEIGSLGQKKPGYLAGNILVREAADIMSRATGEQWTPAEIQETVWSWAKAIYEAKGAKGETRNIPEILMSGEITDDIIRDTPDFATLFGKKGEFRSILEEAGYGQQIGNLPASGFGSRRAVSTGPEGQRNLGSAARRLDRTSRERGIGSAEDIYQFARRLVRPVGDPGSTPGTYRSRNRGLGGGALKDTPVKQYYLPPEKKAELEKLKVPTPTLNEFQAPEKFHEFVSQAKANAGNKSAFLTLYSPEEYANMRTFVTTDGSAGFAIKPDGDIVSVFNNRAGPNKGISPHLISLAIEQGGKKLDAYDGMLMDVYGDMGFVETGRDKWDPKYKPDDWDEATFGTPDVVYMELEK